MTITKTRYNSGLVAWKTKYQDYTAGIIEGYHTTRAYITMADHQQEYCIDYMDYK